jgi:hypothetical protein
VVKKGPDVSQAPKVGEPTLVDPTPIAANQENARTVRVLMGLPADEHGLGVETLNSGTPPAPNEAAPRSDVPAGGAPAASDHPFARSTAAADPNELKPNAASDANGLKPNTAPDPNELTPNPNNQAAAQGGQPLPPTQVNEIQQGQSSSAATAGADASSSLASDQDVSSSKKKKKKGLKKVVPF